MTGDAPAGPLNRTYRPFIPISLSPHLPRLTFAAELQWDEAAVPADTGEIGGSEWRHGYDGCAPACWRC
jgi:hypothetical protein